jgi:hypothetical protein
LESDHLEAERMNQTKHGARDRQTQAFSPSVGGLVAAPARRPSRLRPPALALLLALLLGSSWTAGSPAPGPAKRGQQAGAAPLLLVERTEIDLGQLPKGATAEATFVFRNAGDAELRLHDVQTGCACTVATYDEVIPPGGVGQLQATLITDTLIGEVGQGISVMTNDPTSPAVYLLLRATVVTAVRVLPDLPIELRNYPRRETVRRVIRRAASSGHGFFNIAGLKSSAPWIEASAQKVRAPRQATQELPAVDSGDWILELRLDGQPPYGRKREMVRFETGLDRQPLVELDVYTDCLAPVQLPVERLFLQPGADGAAATLPLTVRDDLDPSGLEVDAAPAGLTVKLGAGAGRERELHVRWSGGTLEQGRLTLRLGGESLEVPVLLVVPGATRPDGS